MPSYYTKQCKPWYEYSYRFCMVLDTDIRYRTWYGQAVRASRGTVPPEARRSLPRTQTQYEYLASAASRALDSYVYSDFGIQ
eukprot:scaffold352490_cov48-Prasinocladus_malaysianus.AAC.1